MAPTKPLGECPRCSLPAYGSNHPPPSAGRSGSTPAPIHTAGHEALRGPAPGSPWVGCVCLGPAPALQGPSPVLYTRQLLLGVTSTTCMSTVLAKTVVVVAAFHGTRLHAQMQKFWGQFSPKPSPWSVNLMFTLGDQMTPTTCDLYRAWAHGDLKCDEGSLELF